MSDNNKAESEAKLQATPQETDAKEENKDNNNSDEEMDGEGFESEDDDISIDLDEATLDCEVADLGQGDLHALHQVIHQITTDFDNELQMESSALEALQESAQAFLIGLFENANLFAQKQNRVTVKAEDIIAVARLGGINLHK
jgi:histone H3/H4